MSTRMQHEVVTRLVDLNVTSIDMLRRQSEEDLGPTMGRVLARVDAPGASISGYNGAGPLARTVSVDLRPVVE